MKMKFIDIKYQPEKGKCFLGARLWFACRTGLYWFHTTIVEKGLRDLGKAKTI